MSWAFQKDSEVADLFSHHINKMKETGTMDKLWQKIESKMKWGNDATNIQEINELGYDNVVLPFWALMTGVCSAILLLVIEAFAVRRGLETEIKNEEEETVIDVPVSRLEAQAAIETLKKYLSQCEDSKPNVESLKLGEIDRFVRRKNNRSLKQTRLTRYLKT